MADYTTITVDAGDTYSVSLSDGETWENYLIDISASGASYDVHASANDFTIRNIGFKGHIDDSSGNQDPFRVRVPDPSATATIENICFDVTCESTERDPGEYHGATGIYHWRDHAGHVDYKNLYFQNFPDNGVYASSPGHDAPDAEGGTISITNAYCKDVNTSCYRLGTSGSSLTNVVGVGNTHRGIWVFYEHPTVEDSDMVDCGSDVALGSSDYEKSWDAEVTMNNCRWVTETAHGNASTSNIHGTPQGSPQDYVPSGVPTTAEDAASGGGGGTATFALATRPPADITHDRARLRGDVDALGAGSATVWFEYRPQGSSTWRETATQSVGSATGVDATVSGLTAGTTYEYRLTGEDADGTTDAGATETVTTRADTDPVDETFAAGDLAAYSGDTARFTVVSDVTPGGT